METSEYYPKGENEVEATNEDDAIAMRRCAEKIWNAISRYVTIDKDAIFKDPDWPYLWDKK